MIACHAFCYIPGQRMCSWTRCCFVLFVLLTLLGSSFQNTNTQCAGICRAPAGYQVAVSGANIEPCPANHYNNGSAKACTPCPAGTLTYETGLTDVVDCPCRPGYHRHFGVCTACGLGTYKEEVEDHFNSLPCTLCPELETTLQTARANASDCVCEPGYERLHGTCQLTACAAGSTLVITGHAASCQCVAGFEFQSTLANGSVVCAACADGLFKDFIGNEGVKQSCGPNTVSSPPRANRTACACKTGYEPGPHDGPDVLGGYCVASCDAGFAGERGVCSVCPAGTFKASRGKLCTACPDSRPSSRPGNTVAAKCSCPHQTFEIDVTNMVVVDSLGPLLDESEESVSALGALLLAANASRPLWRLTMAFKGTGGEASVTVAGRLVYSCGRGSCRNTTLELQGMRGTLNASAPAAKLTLRYRTRRQLILAVGTENKPWWPAAVAQAEAWAAAGRLQAGAAVFRSRSVFSNVASCNTCPRGLRCAAYV